MLFSPFLDIFDPQPQAVEMEMDSSPFCEENYTQIGNNCQVTAAEIVHFNQALWCILAHSCKL
jgi:hypothetical protein